MWKEGIISTSDGHKRAIKYTDDGRWVYHGFSIILPPKCYGQHKNSRPGLMFLEDGGAIKIFFCECGFWVELNHLKTGEPNVWRQQYK